MSSVPPPPPSNIPPSAPQQPAYAAPHSGPAPQKKGNGGKIALACCGGCAVVVILLAIGGFFITQWGVGKAEEYWTELTALPFENQVDSPEELVITEAPTQPTLYRAPTVILDFAQPATVEIGVVAVQLDLKGEFQEKVYFRGGLVQLYPSTTLQKDLDVKCVTVIDQGATVNGSITGDIMVQQ